MKVLKIILKTTFFHFSESKVNETSIPQSNNTHVDSGSLSDEEILYKGEEYKRKIIPYVEMPMRRIIIRFFLALSELFSCKTALHTKYKPSQWCKVGEAYVCSYTAVNRALEIADEEYASLLNKEILGIQLGEPKDEFIPFKKKNLASDAQVVNVAIAHFANERGKYEKSAEKRMQHLELELTPQWKSRDEIKKKMGKRRENNPAATHFYARRRLESERELRDLRNTKKHLDSLDTSAVFQRSKAIYLHMLNGSEILEEEEGSEEKI